MDVASNIKAVRKAKGITPTMMAKELGIEATNYPKFENRGNQLTYNNLERICSALGITVIELLSWDNDGDFPRTEKSMSMKEAHERIKELTTARDIAQGYAESLQRKVYSLQSDIYSIIRNIGDEAGLGTETIIEEDELYTMFQTKYEDSDLTKIYKIIREKYPHMYKMIKDLIAKDIISSSMNELRLFLKYDEQITKNNSLDKPVPS